MQIVEQNMQIKLFLIKACVLQLTYCNLYAICITPSLTCLVITLLLNYLRMF